MFNKLRDNISIFRQKKRGRPARRLSMRLKITLSLCLIAVALSTSTILSVMEYTRMSDYVSDLIAENIRNINVAHRLANVSNAYNLDILTVIGDTTMVDLPDFDEQEFTDYCDSLRTSLKVTDMSHLADSVEYAYAAYMLTSLELPAVLESDFIDTRTWYFERLQPSYGRLKNYIDLLSNTIYRQLQRNSATFERGFYRSIIPSAVAVGVGFLLIFMLLFFLLVYFVNPIVGMTKEMKKCNGTHRKYDYKFDGDDELSDLNNALTEIVNDNVDLTNRMKKLKDSLNQKPSKDES